MVFGSMVRRFTGGKDAETDAAAKEISKHFRVGEINEDACGDCGNLCYPSSLKIEDGPLYNSAPKMYAQILVATGQKNWKHDIGEEPEIWGQICAKLSGATSELEEAAGGKLRINGTDLEYDEGDKDVTVIVLPQFLELKTTPESCVEDVKTALKVNPNSVVPNGMTALNDKGYILLCSHRTRDKRCGITAPLMKEALNIELQQVKLYRDYDDTEGGGVKVVYCNHVGGHKFAANLLLYKNDGTAVMFARMRPEYAKAVVDQTVLDDVLFPEFTRNFNKLAAYSW